jgi:hypothetical protein
MINSLEQFKRENHVMFYTISGAIVGLTSLFCLYTAGMCVAFYNHDEGTLISVSIVQISSWLSRMWVPPLCQPGAPCHVYLTVPRDPTTEMFINFHIADGTCESNNCRPEVYIY